MKTLRFLLCLLIFLLTMNSAYSKINSKENNENLTDNVLTDNISLYNFKTTKYFSYELEYPGSNENQSNPERGYLSRTIEIQWPEIIKNHSINNLQKAILNEAFNDSCHSLNGAIDIINECDKKDARQLDSMPDLEILSSLSSEEKKITLDNIYNSILTFKIYDYEYMAFAAHPLESEHYINFDIKNDRLISIADIIEPEKEKALRNLIIAKTNKKHEHTDFSSVKSFDNFIINNGTITFVFNHYEIACYAEGIIKTDVLFEDIEPMLNKYGRTLLFP